MKINKAQGYPEVFKKTAIEIIQIKNK